MTACACGGHCVESSGRAQSVSLCREEINDLRLAHTRAACPGIGTCSLQLIYRSIESATPVERTAVMREIGNDDGLREFNREDDNDDGR